MAHGRRFGAHLQGFRVHHNDCPGTAKGGIRFHHHETIDTIAPGGLDAWKTAVNGPAPGGRQGRGDLQPKELSAGELQR